MIAIPCAHGEGNYIADKKTLEQIEGNGLVAFRYCSAAGEVGPAFNHNGSTNSIAGIFSPKFNVLGMMPHPENHVDAAADRRRTDGRRPVLRAVGHPIKRVWSAKCGVTTPDACRRQRLQPAGVTAGAVSASLAA